VDHACSRPHVVIVGASSAETQMRAGAGLDPLSKRGGNRRGLAGDWARPLSRRTRGYWIASSNSGLWKLSGRFNRRGSTKGRTGVADWGRTSILPPMALRIAVIMKTDIVGSTLRFRAELAADLETLLREHQQLIAKCAEDHGGSILKSAGDGFWLEYPSVTAAVRSGIAMQDALRLGQLTIGDTRIAIRITIGVGDVSMQDGDLVGELLALVTRIETVTPADEIFLTAGARLALSAAEVQTELVENFALKGFPDPVPIYRVQRRHRTQVISAAFMLIADLGRFTHLARTAEVGAVERVLETLEVLVNSAARKHDGTIRFNNGDAYFLTFPEPSLAVTAAEAPRRVGGRARRRPVRLKHSLAVASWHHQRISVVPLGRGVGGSLARYGYLKAVPHKGGERTVHNGACSRCTGRRPLA
jgi:class 3 adenylate cyclase